MSKNPDDDDEFSEDIDELLKKLVNINSDIIGSALFTTNGALIRGGFAQNTNKALIGEISSIIQTNAEKSVEELSLGQLQRILIQGEKGTIILSNAGENAIISVIVKPHANLGMAFLTIQGLTRKIGSKKLNQDEIDKAINNIISIMKEKQTTVLTIERKYLPELLEPNLLRFNTKDELPVVNNWATIQFGFNGIHITYNKELVNFLN